MDFFRDWGYLIALASFLMFVGTILILPFVLIQIPPDYFLPGHERRLARRHPVIRALVVVARNILGFVLLLIGFAMLFLPGQGLLTMAVAFFVLDFPGKRRFELAILRRPTIIRGVNKLRAALRHPPLRIPPAEPEVARARG
jgi:hypothetical protein